MPFGMVHPGIFSLQFFCLISPGPDTAYIVGPSVSQNPRAGILSSLGVSVGCCVRALFCALGLTALLAASASAFILVRFGGHSIWRGSIGA